MEEKKYTRIMEEKKDAMNATVNVMHLRVTSKAGVKALTEQLML